MKRILLLSFFLISFSHASSAQEFLFGRNDVIISANPIIGFFSGYSGIGSKFGASVEFCVADSGKSSFGVGLLFAGASMTTTDEAIPHNWANIMAIPQFAYHYELSRNWDVYGKIGLGLDAYIPKKDNIKDAFLHLAGDAAIGARFRIWKPICAFVEAGFSYSAAGISLVF